VNGGKLAFTETGYRVGEEAGSSQQKDPVQTCYASHSPALMLLEDTITLHCPQGLIRGEVHLEFDLGYLS
jgi:hypothetical protein